MSYNSIVTRALWVSVARIVLVSICVGVIAYRWDYSKIEDGVHQQLLLSIDEKVKREMLPIEEIRVIEANFVREFEERLADPVERRRMLAEFDLLFMRTSDGSYVQREGLFEGRPLADGRRFKETSLSYPPVVPLNDDIKVRLVLSFLMAAKYGDAYRSRVYNVYAMLPERGGSVRQAVDIGKEVHYSGPDAFDITQFEFFTGGLAAKSRAPKFTKMYYDEPGNTWMVSITTAGAPDAQGRWQMIAGIDLPLRDFMTRTANPTIEGTYNSVFVRDADGTLIFDPTHTGDIHASGGQASLRSLGLENQLAALKALDDSRGEPTLLTTDTEIIAVAAIPGTPWAMTIHYPITLMRPAALANLWSLIAFGLVTLLAEGLLLRAVLNRSVAVPLGRLVTAVGTVGNGQGPFDRSVLPLDSKDEIGTLARAFADMADRVERARETLEETVRQRTEDLEVINLKLVELTVTDPLTGVANRRRFNAALEETWRDARARDAWLGLAMIDIDWFKRFNDTEGHQAGDRCIRSVAAILAKAAPPDAIVARYGGEEFAVLLPGADEAALVTAGEVMRGAVEAARMTHPGSPLGSVTISIGVASCRPSPRLREEGLVRAADEALYRTKAAGRNRVAVAGAEGVTQTGYAPGETARRST